MFEGVKYVELHDGEECGSEASQGANDELVVFYDPLRCSDVPLHDSVVDSHAHGLSFTNK